MADVSQAALKQLTPHLAEADRDLTERMLRYMNRSNLWLAASEGQGDDLVLILANEAERFRIPVTQLRDLWHGLRQGQAIDWDQLERLR